MSEAAGEAELFINGTYAVTFKLGSDPGTQSWERGPYRLTFVPKGGAGGNSGILLLDVPADRVTAGQPLDLRVTPVKARDNSWFMIKDYRDTIGHEHLTPAAITEMVHPTWTN